MPTGLDGIGKAMEEAPFWVAAISALGGLLTAVGARAAGKRVRHWAEEHGPGTGSDETLQCLRSIEQAIRDEGAATRKAIHDEADRTEATVTPIAQGVTVLLDRGAR